MCYICIIYALSFFYIWYMYNICILCITHVCIWHKTVNEYHMFGNKMKYKYFIINKYRNTMLLSKFGFTTVLVVVTIRETHISHFIFWAAAGKNPVWWCVASMARNGFAFSCRVFSQRLFFLVHWRSECQADWLSTSVEKLLTGMWFQTMGVQRATNLLC